MTEARKVFSKPLEVRERLHQLGLREDDLRTALEYGHRHAAQCTDNEPRNAKGLTVWLKSTRMIREVLSPKGWTRECVKGYDTTVAPSGTIAVAVAAGDDGTGIVDAIPHTRSPKGPETKAAVAGNQQSFYQLDPEAFPIPISMETSNRQTWILLHNYDEAREVIRAELSLPTEMSVDGFPGSWRERIILTDIPFGSDGIGIEVTAGPGSGDDTGAVDIEVIRRTEKTG